MHQRTNRSFKLLWWIFLVFLLCQTLPALAADGGTDTTVTGEVTVLYADDFENKRSELIYRLREIHSDRTFNLHLPDKVKEKLQTGAVIKIRGRASGGEFYLPADGTVQPVQTGLSAAAAVSGEQRTIVLLANFTDAALSCSTDEVRDLMFTDISDNSVDDLYQETSLTEVWFTGDVAGPYTLDYYSSGSCDYSGWASALEAAASAEGINFSAYNRKVYVSPRSNTCGWAGLGTVGGNPSRSWILRCGIPDVYAHELGHNLGMYHASKETVTPDGKKTINEYGDTSDIMGYGGYPLRQINAPHQEQMGWRAPAQIQTVTAGGLYDIAPLELYALETVAPQVLKIAIPNTYDSYYLSYRQSIGFDGNLRPEYLDGLAVHRYNGGRSRTYYLTTLADGLSYVDATHGMTFTQVGHSAQGVSVDIRLAGSGPVCGDSLCNGDEDVCTCPGDCGSPPAEVCDDGIDNDCDGFVDSDDVTDCPPPGPCDGFRPESTACGVGACRSTGTTTCDPATGTIDDTCTPRDPTPEVCHDRVDNDCDGLIDGNDVIDCTPSGPCDGFVPEATACGVGQCRSTGTTTCDPATGSVDDTCTPRDPTPEVCNDGIDNDCDGAPDCADGDCADADVCLPDTEPPTTPGGLWANVKRKHVNLSWVASTDNVGVARYKVWRDGAVIGETTGTGYTDRSLSRGTTNTYTVSAVDAAGNESGHSNAVTVTLSGGRPNRGRVK